MTLRRYLPIIKKVKNLKVDYMVIGGIAANYYGSNTPTGDVDFAFSIPSRDIPRVSQHFIRLGFTATPKGSAVMLEDPRTGFLLDLVPGITAGTKIELDRMAFSRRQEKEILPGEKFWFATAEDVWLGEMNKFKHTRDIRAVFHAVGVAKNSRLDMDYLNRWVRVLKLDPQTVRRGLGVFPP